MTRRVFLHIGAPKTGTTYLQDRMARNARDLARHGVHFPSGSPVVSPGLSQFRAALDLMGQDWGGPRGHARGAWHALLRRARKLEGTVVISHEILAPAKPEQVARAMHELRSVAGFDEVHLVYTVRDWGRQLPAAWQESIKQGRHWSYRRYRKKITRGRPWFARAFDLPAVLGTWAADLPPDRVHVVTVPHERGDQLWQRWCGVVGIDPAWAPLDSERRNRSLGAAEAHLLRALNRRLRRTTRRELDFDPIIRELAEDRLAARRSHPLRMPPRLHRWAVGQGEEWAAWLIEAGVDVVGDLAELRPGPPADDYVDPDRVRSRAQLDVALDALVGLTHEAARRTDPDQRIVSRVRHRLSGRPDRAGRADGTDQADGADTGPADAAS